MFFYSFFGLVIHSELEFPDLPAGDENPDVIIRFGPVSRTPRQAGMDEEIAIHEFGGFHIKQGREIVADPLPNVDPDALRVLLLGRMMAFLLRQRGWLPLHASGAAIDGQGVLFLGASGSGKSTTAAVFHSRGHRVISDDVGAVRAVGTQCHVRSAGSRVRLLQDSRSVFAGAEPPGAFQWDKYAFDLGRAELQGSLPVRRIYLLEYGPELRIEFVPPLNAVTLLSTHSFVIHRRMAREALESHLKDCAAVADLALVRSLFRPRSLGALTELVRLVESDVSLI